MTHAGAVEYEPALVEGAVLCAVTGRHDEPVFRAARDPLYEISDADAREAAFSDLHARWFDRLGLAALLVRALAEVPALGERCGRRVVARARAARDEGADLRVAPPAPPTLLLRLRPETFRDPARLSLLLRRELQHVADILDPAFGYERSLGAGESGLPDAVLTGRYRAAWDAWVDGRLRRRGAAPAGVRAERRQDFVRAFPGLGDGLGRAFDRFFDATSCTHAELAAFATGGAEGRPTARCPLCRMPAPTLEPGPAESALCPRCAEIRRSPSSAPEK